MDGVITGITDKQVTVTVPELGTGLIVAADGHRNLSINQAVTIGVRSEHVQTVRGPGQNTLRGTLSSTVENLASVNCWFDLKTGKDGNYRLEAAFPRGMAAPLSDGSNYYLHLPPEQIVIITN